MTCIAVLEHEPAECDIVARRILDTLDYPFGSQTHEHLRIQLGMYADGKVVCEKRQIGMLPDLAKMPFVLAWATQSIEGRCCNDGIYGHLGYALHLIDDAHRLYIDDAYQNRNASIDYTDGFVEHLHAFLVGKESHLAAGSKEEKPIDAGIYHAVDAEFESFAVKRSILMQWDDDRGYYTAEF